MRNRSLLLCSLVLAAAGCADENLPTTVESIENQPSLLTSGGHNVFDLGTLKGGTYSLATDLNNNGVVVGVSEVRGGLMRAFLWSSGTMKALPILKNFENSRANGINSLGTVVGNVSAVAEERAVLWPGDGTVYDIGHLDLPGWTTATAVNDKNVVVGYSLRDLGTPITPKMTTHAFRWTPTGGMVGLSLALDHSFAYDINNSGFAVGSAGMAGQMHAYLWRPTGSATDLGTLGGAWAEAYAISDAGVVVGISETALAEIHGFRWTSGTGMVDLGLVNDNWHATDVNLAGRIVGNRNVGPGGAQAFERVPSGFYFLDGLAPNQPRRAYAVNHCGWIAGQAATASSEMHAALWKKRSCDE